MAESLHPDVILAGLLDTASHSSCPSCRSVAAAAHARLVALEEIRRRVADGYLPQRAFDAQPARWVKAGYPWGRIASEVAAVLWPGAE